MPLSLSVDLIIVIVLLIFACDGYRRGFILLLLEVVVVVVSLLLASFLSPYLMPFLDNYLNVPEAIQRPISFFGLWLVLQGILNLGAGYGYQFIPENIRQSKPNSIAGIAPSILKGLITSAVFLMLIVILPTPQQVKSAISNSAIGGPLVERSQQVEQYLAHRYSKELTDTFTFLTNTPFFPQSNEKSEFVQLKFKTTTVTDDPSSETEMLALLNQERAKEGLKPLNLDAEMRAVARAHGRDMFARGYFSHDNPDGENPFDRIQKAQIVYLTAGENLALAPTVELAHVGLMNSPKHKENILYPEFGSVGIGVIDGGIYGKMFVQEFKD